MRTALLAALLAALLLALPACESDAPAGGASDTPLVQPDADSTSSGGDADAQPQSDAIPEPEPSSDIAEPDDDGAVGDPGAADADAGGAQDTAEAGPEPEPEPDALPETDADASTGCLVHEDCAFGAQWCEAGACVPCDNSGAVCDMACAPGTGFVTINGCTPCVCEAVDECETAKDCEAGYECAPGYCGKDCDPGEPGCCVGATCQPEGGGGSCTKDVECAFGAEWCQDGSCEPCDNSGLLCFIACGEGFTINQRNGCTPCQCTLANECTSNVECGAGTCVAGPICYPWCDYDDPSCCFGNTCEAGPPACEGPNPQACVETQCPPGMQCVASPLAVCMSSSCTCDASGGWLCTDDCTSGVCVAN